MNFVSLLLSSKKTTARSPSPAAVCYSRIAVLLQYTSLFSSHLFTALSQIAAQLSAVPSPREYWCRERKRTREREREGGGQIRLLQVSHAWKSPPALAKLKRRSCITVLKHLSPAFKPDATVCSCIKWHLKQSLITSPTSPRFNVRELLTQTYEHGRIQGTGRDNPTMAPKANREEANCITQPPPHTHKGTSVS